jgi:hypothetical protein
MLYLKHLDPPLHYREIAWIVRRKYGYTTNHLGRTPAAAILRTRYWMPCDS